MVFLQNKLFRLYKLIKTTSNFDEYDNTDDDTYILEDHQEMF